MCQGIMGGIPPGKSGGRRNWEFENSDIPRIPNSDPIFVQNGSVEYYWTGEACGRK